VQNATSRTETTVENKTTLCICYGGAHYKVSAQSPILLRARNKRARVPLASRTQLAIRHTISNDLRWNSLICDL
jgi:hypothetical protein